MRWASQEVTAEAPGTLPGLNRIDGLVRSIQTPEFAGLAFHEVLAKSALNRTGGSRLPFSWTINPYRGCSHACVYCFARSSHSYLGLDDPRDFDTQIVVKVNVADVLTRELARPSWNRDRVALGTNTDPYQRAEGRYRLMPGIVSALAGSGTPFSILTKGTLIRRDLPLLADAARGVRVGVALSVPVVDDALQRSIEPGAPSAAARLETVAQAREAGLEVGVVLAPILPFLTDSDGLLDDVLGLARDAGASYAWHDVLNLRSRYRGWFEAWLMRERPDLVRRYRALYAGGGYVPRGYRNDLDERIGALIRRHGLDRGGWVGDRGDDRAEAGAPVTAPTLF